jgi:hypothetical protein
MTRTLLILSQICALALPVGVCTCEHTGSATKQESKSCACCRKQCTADCPLTHDSSPTQSRNQPCREPSCPANPSFARVVTGIPTQPAPALPPMTLLGSVEPNLPNSQFAGQRPNDAVLLPTAYLFLIYGTLLI